MFIGQGMKEEASTHMDALNEIDLLSNLENNSNSKKDSEDEDGSEEEEDLDVDVADVGVL